MSINSKAYQKEYRRKNWDKISEQKRLHRLRNPDSYLASDLKCRYGISLQKYQDMLVAQNGCCSICCRNDVKLVVDHCHASGKVRSMICDACNKMLGFAKEDITTLQNAIDYLKKHQAKN